MGSPKFIDLFAGIGGIRLGFEKAGFECVFSSEIDRECSRMYQANFKEVPHGDIKLIKNDSVPSHDVLTAGFPCQPFSISGKQKGFDDTRGTLFFEILRILQAKKPSAFLLENVKHLKYHDKGRTLGVMLSHLKELGYKVNWKVLNAKDFSVPQNRERVIIVGGREKEFDFDALKNTRMESMRSVLDSSGNFEFLEPSSYTLIKNTKRQESGLIFAGYRNKKIRENGTRPNTVHLSRVHKQPNRIYSSEGTHPTLPSQESSGRFFILHNGVVRKLTIEECFRLMGFPENFRKVSSRGELYRQIGNSVCVPMIEEVANQIKMQMF